ncbi:MAG: DUF1127 domain-containing protein [Alphaproteobacteria bacterium]|nr:DUF1127 domain-containing protein [Alphaproteobacteria bacterium]
MTLILRRLRLPFAGTLELAASLLRAWFHRATTRRQLRDLDARALADVGLTERERERECARWFWQ